MIFMGLLLALTTQLIEAKNYYGVVIGCCAEYEHKKENRNIPALHAQDDAESFYKILIDMYYQGNPTKAEEKLYLLTERRATRERIKNTLKNVAKKAQPNDVVYFFYSGHGSSLADKSKIIKVSYRNNKLMKAMENSGLIVPYNFRFKDVLHTAIIGSRDLRDNEGFGLSYLDKKGVQVVMISDSCFAGNIYRTSNNTTGKYIPISQQINTITANSSKPEEKSYYNNLIFFSAGGTSTVVTENDRLGRGKFTLALEKCLKTANQNQDNKITKGELEACLRTEDTARAFIPYPANRLSHHTVFKAPLKRVTLQQKDKIRVKSSIHGLKNLSNQIVIDNKNYDIEIIRTKNRYKIFRYTGEEYANVDKSHLSLYLNALKLFKLKGSEKLDIALIETKKRKEMAQFCDGEELAVEIKNQKSNKYVVAITLNNQGGVIMLQPNDYQTTSSTIVRTKAQYPFGMDKLKVFILSSQQQYNKIKELVVKDGVLNNYAVNKLYNILKSNKNYKEAEIDIETIGKPVNYCREGDL